MVMIVNAMNGISSYMINPSLPNYLSSKGVLFEVTGIISSLLSWIALLFRPVSGLISDRLNKKKVMLCSYFVSAVCMFAYSQANSVTLIIAIRILHGVAFAISGTISMSFATSLVPKERIAEGVGFLGMATLMGSMFGPQIGSEVEEMLGMKGLFLVATALYVLCLCVLFFIPYKYEVKAGVKKAALKLNDLFAYELLMYVVLIGLFSFGNGIISYYLKSMGSDRGIENVALFFTVYSFSMFLMKPFVGKIQDKMGVKVILYPALLINAAGMIILSKAYTLTPVLIAAVFKAIGQGNGSPAIQSEAIKTLGLERNGVAISTCFIGQDIGNALGPIYGAFVIKNMGYSAVFQIYAGFLIAGMVAYFVYDNKNKLFHKSK